MSLLSTHSWVLRGYSTRQLSTGVDSIQTQISTKQGSIGVVFERATSASSWGGKALGMDILTIDTGRIRTTILPDRGMGIWKCWVEGIEFGWQSPVDGPVHPALVPVSDSTGLGWLEGFDELLVRCGLHSNGAPEFQSNGTVRYPLHGRIANLPARDLQMVVNEDEGWLDVIGTVSESRFLVYSLRLESRYRFRPNSSIVEVTDTVTNPLSTATSMQMLYHINIGQPVLEAGSKIHAAFKTLSPRDAQAAKSVQTWDRCEGPTSSFAEQVYFMQAAADKGEWSETMIASELSQVGFSVHFDTRTLPYLNLWKNTADVEDGYVVGLEPATGFPNTKSFEEKGQRIVSLAGGESRVFRLKLEPLIGPDEIKSSIERIASQKPDNAVIHDQPQKGWCTVS